MKPTRNRTSVDPRNFPGLAPGLGTRSEGDPLCCLWCRHRPGGDRHLPKDLEVRAEQGGKASSGALTFQRKSRAGIVLPGSRPHHPRYGAGQGRHSRARRGRIQSLQKSLPVRSLYPCCDLFLSFFYFFFFFFLNLFPLPAANTLYPHPPPPAAVGRVQKLGRGVRWGRRLGRWEGRWRQGSSNKQTLQPQGRLCPLRSAPS